MSNVVGELRARMVAEHQQMRQAVKETKKDFSDLGEEGKKTAKSFTDLSAALDKVGANADQLKKMEKAIREANPAKLEKGLAEVIAEMKRLGAESKQIATVEKALKDVSAESNKAKEGISGLQSGIAALGAGAATAALARTIKSLTDEALNLSRAYGGLTEVSKALNVNVGESTALADKLADRWGLSKTAMAETVKTYLTAGMTLQQTEKIITATADAAVYNREAHLSWDEAIRQVAQGVKMGNSELTDAAGITTNLSVMQERYAKSIGTTAAKLTESQKVQAAYNGIVQESVLFAGNADKAMTGYTGTQANFNQTLQTARVELGEAFIPVLNEMLNKITPIIRGIAEWASENKEMVAGLGAAAIAVGTLIAVMTTLISVSGLLATAFKALGLSLGPVGIAATIIGTVATGVLAYVAASDAAAESVMVFAKNQGELNKKLDESPLKRTATEVKNLQSDIGSLNKIMEQRNKLMNEYNALEAKAQSGQGSVENTHKLMDLADKIKDIDKGLRDMDYKNADEAAKALQRMNKAYEDSIPARLELQRADIADVATKIKQVDSTDKLRKRYEELSKVEKLSQAQKNELANVIQELSKQYPDLIAQLDSEGKYLITNKDIVYQQIEAERTAVKLKAELRKQDIEDLKKITSAKLEQAKAEITAMQAVIQASTTKTGLDAAPTFDESKVNPLLTGQAREYAIAAGKSLNEEANRQLKKQTESANELTLRLNEIKRMQDDLTAGKWNQYLPSNPLAGLDTPAAADDKKKGKTPEEIAAEMRKKAFQDEMSLIRYKADMYDWDADQQIESYQKIQDKHKQYLAESAEDERSLNLLLKGLDEEKAAEKEKNAEKAAKASYQVSSEWIDMEERRMRERGATDREVLQMQLETWTRVRARYQENSDQYKQADKAMYDARMALRKEDEKAQKAVDEAQADRIKDITDSTLKAIEKAKKAELDALDDRRKAIQKFYDDQADAIDDSERLKERNELTAEMEKYRFATSEKGQKTFQELQEKLRKMDVEDQKLALERQRDQELENLDQQKEDIESWYEDMKDAAGEFSGDLSIIYALAEDSRLAAFISTNAKIKAEMAKFTQELSTNSSSGQTASSSSSPYESSVLYQMRANSAAWQSATPAERPRLEADNQSLGASIGASYNSTEGTWYKNGIPLYHSGGIAGEMNFRSDNLLLPDEIHAILKRGEPVLTQDQIGSLVSGVSSSGQTIVQIEKVQEINNPVFEDGIDLRALGRESGDVAADVVRKSLTGG